MPHEFQFVHAHFPAKQIAGLDLEIERLSAELSLECLCCHIAGQRYGLAAKLERPLGRRLHANDAVTEAGAGPRNAEIACRSYRRGSCHINSDCILLQNPPSLPDRALRKSDNLDHLIFPDAKLEHVLAILLDPIGPAGRMARGKDIKLIETDGLDFDA